MDHESDGYSDEVEREHGEGEKGHADGVGGGADNGGDEEDAEDGVAEVLEKETAVYDAEEGEEKHEDWQLKGDAEAENDGHEEAGVILDGEDGVEPVAELEHEDLDRAGQDVVVAEKGSAHEEEDGRKHERPDVLSLILVHAGRDEEPDLVKDERRRQDRSAYEGSFEIEVQAVGGVGEVEGNIEFIERGLNDSIEALVKVVGNGEADEQETDGPEQAAAKLFEVFHQAHARKFGAVLYSAPGAVDQVILHAESPSTPGGKSASLLGCALGVR